MSPRRPQKPCHRTGCRHLQPCPVHRHEPPGRKPRPNFRDRGYDQDDGDGPWLVVRAKVLKRDPVCRLRRVCSGAKSTTAAHIIPKKSGGKNTMRNLVGSCRQCNSSEAAALDGAFGNRRKR